MPQEASAVDLLLSGATTTVVAVKEVTLVAQSLLVFQANRAVGLGSQVSLVLIAP